MPLSFLLATTNQDKSIILRNLFDDLLENAKLNYTTLRDVLSPSELDEVGTITERATQKALYYGTHISFGFDGVIGSDDGIEVIGYHPTTPASAEMTDMILGEDFPIGTQIIIHRSIALFIPVSGKSFVVDTRIPFTYAGNPDQIRRENGTYPLSQVLIPEGYKVQFAKLSLLDQRIFTFKHSKIELMRIKKWLEEILLTHLS